MSTIKTQDGKVITKDGKISCECCGLPCALGGTCVSSGTNVAKAITNAEAATYYAGGTWSSVYSFSIDALLEGYFQEFATDPPTRYISYETNFSETATHTFAYSGCDVGIQFGPVSTGDGLIITDYNASPPTSSSGSSGSFSVFSQVINLRKNPAGGYCLFMGATVRSGYFGSSPGVHSKNDVTSMTLEGTTATTGSTECGTNTSVVLNPSIVRANGTTTINATFSPAAP